MHSDHIDASEIRRFEQQYAEHPESFVFARLADAYRKAGNPERALEILAGGLERHPEYISAHIVHARCLLDLRRGADAAGAWRRVVDLDPENLVALRELTELALAAEDQEAARRWGERLAQIEPLGEETARLLSEAAQLARESERTASQPELSSATAGTADEAEDRQAEGVSALREAGMITATMADLYLQQGLYEEAAAIYWELVKRHPADPSLRERLAKARSLGAGPRGEGLADRPEGAVEGLETWARDLEAGLDDWVRHERPTAIGAVGAGAERASAPEGGGIRAHLQALIHGRARLERFHDSDADANEERESTLAEGGEKVPEPERSFPGFGDWLRRRKR
jgi:tetratricopeptide (TPR) repeat protein